MTIELAAASGVALLATFVMAPRFKAYLENSGIVDQDVQKRDKPWMASSGGLPVIFGFLGGTLTFVFLDNFVSFIGADAAIIFSAILTVLIATLVGLLDDIHARRRRVRRAGGQIGLRQWQKPLLTVAAAIPLMVTRAGTTNMIVPFFGALDFGLLYPLLLVPVAVVSVTNATNMLAGMNGLETGMGSTALLGIGWFALTLGQMEAALIAFSAAAALLAFLYFNFYPSRMLPGDSLTYFIGASIVASVVIGNIERFGVFVFLPWIVEAFLKFRGGFSVSSLGKLQKDGTLKPKHERILSLTHVGMRLGWTERRIVAGFIVAEVVLVLIGLSVF